jgi:hypothetical protein
VFKQLISVLGADSTPSEVTSRYLLQSRHCTASTGRVSPRAFHPAARDHKTSVLRVQELTERQIWSLGDQYVAVPLGKELRARAELSVAQTIEVRLQVEPAEPPPRHANIVDWPIEKHEWMSCTQELAALTILRLRETNTEASQETP